MNISFVCLFLSAAKSIYNLRVIFPPGVSLGAETACYLSTAAFRILIRFFFALCVLLSLKWFSRNAEVVVG